MHLHRIGVAIDAGAWNRTYRFPCSWRVVFGVWTARGRAATVAAKRRFLRVTSYRWRLRRAQPWDDGQDYVPSNSAGSPHAIAQVAEGGSNGAVVARKRAVRQSFW